jgi:2-hydroxychromene-2-carboxylate isomerase
LNAPKSAEWHFDFISPYAYLQFEMMERISVLADVNLTPIVLAGILKTRGQLGPARACTVLGPLPIGKRELSSSPMSRQRMVIQ